MNELHALLDRAHKHGLHPHEFTEWHAGYLLRAAGSFDAACNELRDRAAMASARRASRHAPEGSAPPPLQTLSGQAPDPELDLLLRANRGVGNSDDWCPLFLDGDEPRTDTEAAGTERNPLLEVWAAEMADDQNIDSHGAPAGNIRRPLEWPARQQGVNYKPKPKNGKGRNGLPGYPYTATLIYQHTTPVSPEFPGAIPRNVYVGRKPGERSIPAMDRHPGVDGVTARGEPYDVNGCDDYRRVPGGAYHIAVDRSWFTVFRLCDGSVEAPRKMGLASATELRGAARGLHDDRAAIQAWFTLHVPGVWAFSKGRPPDPRMIWAIDVAINDLGAQVEAVAAVLKCDTRTVHRASREQTRAPAAPWQMSDIRRDIKVEGSLAA